ncbi:hypothetical protein J5J10_22215, partial [Ciceribacter sp. L1K23]|uniref:hypothetical protein n=1 Tax=Ciceribacter sp. L1K23 TaxID=2820276 RepID=UPI001B80EA23
TEISLHGINTSRQKAKSVTHVFGTKRHLSLRSDKFTPKHTEAEFQSDGLICPIYGGQVPVVRSQ